MSFVATYIKDGRLTSAEYENKNEIPENAQKITELIKNDPIFKIVVDYCQTPENPIKADYCPVKFIISDAFRYASGNYTFAQICADYDADGPDDLIRKVRQSGGYIDFLSAYVHGGVSLSRGYTKGWDFSQIGFIYVDPNEIDKNLTEKAADNWIKTYNQYLNGEIYEFSAYQLGPSGWELVDTMSDFYNLESMNDYINAYEPSIKDVRI